MPGTTVNPKHPIDLFHAVSLGMTHAGGLVLTAAFTPAFDAGEFRLFAAGRFDVLSDGAGNLILSGNGASTLRFTFGTECSLTDGEPGYGWTACRERFVIPRHRGFGYAFLFPPGKNVRDVVEDFISRSLTHELVVKKTDTVECMLNRIRRSLDIIPSVFTETDDRI